MRSLRPAQVGEELAKLKELFAIEGIPPPDALAWFAALCLYVIDGDGLRPKSDHSGLTSLISTESKTISGAMDASTWIPIADTETKISSHVLV